MAINYKSEKQSEAKSSVEKQSAPSKPEIRESIDAILQTPARKKVQISIRLDEDLVSRLRATGHGWQRRLNDIIRQALARGY